MIAYATKEAGDLVVLAIHEGGLRKPFGKKKLVSLADFKGTTIRAPQSKVLADGLSALGANADPLPLPDVYQALQTGTVNGVEANLPLIYLSKWYEVAKYVTGNVNLWPFPTVLAINKAKYDSLTDAQKAALTSSAAGITDFSIKIFTTPGSPIAAGARELRGRVRQLDRRREGRSRQGGRDRREPAGRREPGLRQADPGAQGRDPAAAAAAALPHRQDRGVHAATGRLAEHPDRPHGRRAKPVRHHTGPAPEGVGPVCERG